MHIPLPSNRFYPRHLYLAALLAYLIALCVGCAVLWKTQAHIAGFSGADESSHFLNGVFVNEYLRAHFPGNPMAFAVDYYIHYPKISIGHWPPAYYGFLGLLFFIVPPTPTAAMVINLLVSALPAAAIGAMLAHVSRLRFALTGASIYAVTPLVLGGYDFFMLDQALAGVTVAAMLCWVAYSNRQSWGWAFGFAALFTVAVLIKGNGWLLVFVPLFYILLTGTWRVLKAPPIYVALCVSAAIVVPWYWLTSGISADGFNYQAGIPYALLALTANAHTLSNNLSWICVPLALIAIIHAYRQRQMDRAQWHIATGCLSLIVATLMLQSLIPVDIVDRYMAPALPAMVALAVLGIRALFQSSRRFVPIVAVAAVIVMVAPGAEHFLHFQHKVNMRSDATAALLNNHASGANVASSPAAHITLIDGTAGAEGDMIAALALTDPALQHYAVRASKLFADSNFMGSSYQLKFSEESQVLAELERLGVENIVVVRLNDRDAFPHSTQLIKALALPNSNFKKIKSLPHAGRDGITDIYRATVPVVANVAAVRSMGTPSKANVITKRIN